MECRETQTLLSAFHDGELPADDRVRVEEHLRGCPECSALLADLARADQAAGVPDPGPAYWDRFNARVTGRVEREADGPKVAILRPKGGWMRQQLRYLVPAAAAAALVVVVVRYGGMNPGAPTPTVPPAVSEPATPVPAADGMTSGMEADRKKMAGAAALMAEQEVSGKAKSASGMRIAKESSPGSPCELARTLAERERFREAEDAQRACLAGDLPAPSREKELVFLAELLDRQARFPEADAVIAEVDRQFPQSRPLDLYRQRRPMVQKRRE